MFLAKIKSKASDKLRSSSNQFAGIKLYENHLVNNQLIWSDSYDNYCQGKDVPVSRKFKWYMIISFLWLHFFKYTALYVWSEPSLSSTIGDTIHALYKTKLSALLLMTGIMISISDLLLFRYLEYKNKLKIIEIFCEILTTNRIDGLSKAIANKLMVNSYLIAMYMFNFQLRIFRIVCMILVIILCHQAYLDTMYNHTLPSLIVNSICSWYCVVRMFEIIFTKIYLFIVTEMYLNYRFLDVFETIKTSAKPKSLSSYDICLHKKFRDVLGQISPFVNLAIGVVYYLTPTAIVVTMIIAKDQEAPLWKRLIFANFTIVIFLFVFFMSKLSTIIPNTNKAIPKLLYPLFCGHSRGDKSILLMIKVDEFKASLNRKFLGFYCFNMFKFTKFSFYKLMFGIILTYLLIINKFQMN
jgi:hypothetical protein